MSRTNYRSRPSFFAGLLCAVLFWPAIAATKSVQENPVQVREWNRFVQRLHSAHRTFLRIYDIREEEQIGGYAGDPNFYREVSYFDAATDRLLSRIRWETQQPNTIHVIELFFYDDQGRLERDYSAAFLPRYRNSPYQTLINVHRYNGDLHSFRQFDASGARIYEHCTGTWFDRPVAVELEEPLVATPDSVIKSESYIACFGLMPTRVGNYLDPAWTLAGSQPSRRRAPDQGLEARIASLDLRLRFSPDKPELFLERCQAYFELRNFDKAIEDCSRTIKLNQDLDKAYFWRGMARGRHGDIAGGIDDLSLFIERNPKSSLAYTKRGVRYIWNGDLSAAKKDLLQAIELNNNNAEAHDDLGVILAQERHYEDAIVHFRTTIRIDPDYQKAHHNLALVLHLQARNGDALDAINQALRLGPDMRSSVLLKANILKRLGHMKEALKWQQKADSMPQRNWSENLAIR